MTKGCSARRSAPSIPPHRHDGECAPICQLTGRVATCKHAACLGLNQTIGLGDTMLTRKAKRGTAGALLLSDAIFVIGVGGYLATQRSLVNAGRVTHPQEVLAGIDEIHAGLLSAESSVRRHVLTDNKAFPGV